MAIVVRALLPVLIASVRADFAANAVTANVDFGWNRTIRQDNQGAGGANRVVFMPSDEAGNGGEIRPARFMGDRNVRDADGKVVGNIRALQDVEEIVTVFVWARDAQHPDDEVAQYEATVTLAERTMIAIHGAPGAYGCVTWRSRKWRPPLERAFGRELQLVLTIDQPIFARPRMLAFPSGVAVARGPLTIDPPGVVAGGDT